MESLFQDSQRPTEPLAKRLSPKNLEEFVGQEQIVEKGKILHSFITKDRAVSSIFYGPPGCGKTALAKIIAHLTKSEFIRLNAVTARIEDLRSALNRAAQNRLAGTRTVLFIDEIHRFNKMQQDGLLPALEEGVVTFIGTTTKNPFFSLTPPIRSRVLLFEFHRLDNEHLEKILRRAEKAESIQVNGDAAKYLIRFSNGDARRLLNLLEAALIVEQGKEITLESIEKIIQKQPVLYDRDEDYHYDVISAFIKSIRGSDPDAALYWLAVMLEGGEDPLFIARRLVILASEDVGLADSFSLVLAESAYHAVDKIGMPEARLILSHITLYLALQPKSNSVYKAIEKAQSHVKSHETHDVPTYLRSTHPDTKNYKYPHDYAFHYVNQEYMIQPLLFYEPGELGEEKNLKKTLEFFRRLKSGGKTSDETK